MWTNKIKLKSLIWQTSKTYWNQLSSLTECRTEIVIARSTTADMSGYTQMYKILEQKNIISWFISVHCLINCLFLRKKSICNTYIIFYWLQKNRLSSRAIFTIWQLLRLNYTLRVMSMQRAWQVLRIRRRKRKGEKKTLYWISMYSNR